MSATLTFLGTASVTPEAGHDTASFLINGDILVDTGWSAAIRMLSYGFSPLDLEYLILTHCHHDHYLGLPQLLFYRRMRQRDRHGLRPLKIIGPAEDLERVVKLSRDLLQADRFPDVDHVPEVVPLSPGDRFECCTFHLETCNTIHAVQGLCYRYGDPGGTDFGFTGDTAYHPSIARFLKDCPFIVHEAAHGPRRVENARESGHSSAEDAARIAKGAQADRLGLVHLREEDVAQTVEVARRVFPNVFCPEDGEAVTI